MNKKDEKLMQVIIGDLESGIKLWVDYNLSSKTTIYKNHEVAISLPYSIDIEWDRDWLINKIKFLLTFS